MRDKGLLDGLLWCQEHDCPIIQIGDDYACILEYTDELLGQRRVRDIVPGAPPRRRRTGPSPAPARLVFDNNLTLPLICADCGGPIHVTEPDAVLALFQGLYLVGLGYSRAKGDQSAMLSLFFSPDPEGEPREDATVTVHPDAVRKIA